MKTWTQATAKTGLIISLIAPILAFAACVGDTSSNGNPGDAPDGATDSAPQDSVLVDGSTTDGGSATDADTTSTQDVSTNDAADAVAPAVPACDLKKPFGTATAMTGVINSASADESFTLLPDSLTVFFDSARTIGGAAGGFDLYAASRGGATAPFAALTNLTSLNTSDNERGPAITADGKTIYFTRGPNNNGEIWMATRSSGAVPFDAPQDLAAPVNGANDWVSWVSPDGARLYLASDRTEPNGDLYVATRIAGGGFNAPVAIPSLSSPAAESTVILTPDELQAFIGSERAGGGGGLDIWYASRASTSAGFSTPVPVAELNSSGTDFPAWVSSDGCTLWFATGHAGLGGYDIFVASRPK